MSIPRLLHLLLCALVLCLAGITSSASAATGSLPYTGGHDAQNDKPFVAGIRWHGDTKFWCTGTLVRPQWVLTAAHCVDAGVKASKVEVVLGDTDLNTTTDPAEIHTPPTTSSSTPSGAGTRRTRTTSR